MKNLLILLVLIAVGIAALGVSRGWFTLATEKTDDAKTHVSITVDNPKIDADKETAKEKLQDMGDKIQQKTNEGLDKLKQGAP